MGYFTSATPSVMHKTDVEFYFILSYFYNCLKKRKFRNVSTSLELTVYK